MANYDVTTRKARLKLEVRARFYPREAGAKRLGYTRRADRNGIWTTIESIPGTKRVNTRRLGQADDYTRADGVKVLTYEQALEKAVTTTAAAAPTGNLTVEGALERYFTWLAGHSKHAKEYQSSANKHIVGKFRETKVVDLTKTQVEAWQTGLLKFDQDNPEVKRRSQDTANRILTHLKAALNKAFGDVANKIPTDTAWRLVKPFKGVARARKDDLDYDQVRLLIAKAASFDQALANLMEGSFLVGTRPPSELAMVDVRDFDPAHHLLKIRFSKTGPRDVTLTQEAVKFFSALAKDKLPQAPLLPKLDGSRWERSGHFRAVKRAVALAKLPPSVSLYTLRHAHISRAIENGRPLSLIAENCGTSLLMIDQNYSHVLARTRKDTIEKTAIPLRIVA